MQTPTEVTVDSFAEDLELGNEAVDRDEPDGIVPSASGPAHVIREDVPAIDENEPTSPRESDVITPVADAAMPDVEQAEQRWKAEIRDAVARWDRLTEADVLALARHGASLTALVQE